LQRGSDGKTSATRCLFARRHGAPQTPVSCHGMDIGGRGCDVLRVNTGTPWGVYSRPEHVMASDNQNRRVALMASSVAVAMLGLAYASVPLYRLFCQATGFGGTTQVASASDASATTQDISIRFDANSAAEMGWNFRPKQTTMTVKIGEPSMAYFVATNASSQTVTGTAMFNVTPAEAGIFFNKIECFCFTEQTLKAGETVEMPVQFFVDSALLEDADTKSIREITLSYSFYPLKTKASEKQAALKQN
jgi:cytochrome c oxidase assembly protein subunit 11